MGLVARACEAAGMRTCCVALVREVAERVRPPRAVHVRWPFGNPLGEPGHVAQQRQILRDMLAVVDTAASAGVIVDLPYLWRRHDYGDPGEGSAGTQ